MHVAHEEDQRSILLTRPYRIGTTGLSRKSASFPSKPTRRASRHGSRSGTVVIGQDVQISTVAVTQGNLTVQITETPQVSQPNAFARGRTVVTPNTQIDTDQSGGPISIVRAPTSAPWSMA